MQAYVHLLRRCMSPAVPMLFTPYHGISFTLQHVQQAKAAGQVIELV